MRRMLCGLGMAAAMLVGSAAHAIDVRNEDQRSYQLQITSTSMKRDLELRGGSLSLVVCVGMCDFFVPGVGRTKARGNDVVLIKNGRIITETDATRAAQK